MIRDEYSLREINALLRRYGIIGKRRGSSAGGSYSQAWLKAVKKHELKARGAAKWPR